MGTVKEIRMSGDNDEPIHPVRYEMKYYYCDNCGSFELKDWKAAEHPEKINSQLKNLWLLSRGLILFAGLMAIFAFFLLLPAIIVVLVLFALVMVARSRLKSQISVKGIACKSCGTQYEFGSPFFVEENNPQNLTMEDVPRPLNSNYTRTGATLGRVDEKE